MNMESGSPSIVTEPCIDGYKTHKYGLDNSCERCGFKKPIYRRTKSTTRQSGSSTTSRTQKVEPTLSRSDARDGIAMIILAAQTLILARREDLKPDALTPRERMLLADALAEEAYESTAVRRFLAKVGQQKKHAKLGMALTAIMLPRLARHGLIPQEGIEELANELVTTSSKAAGFSGDTATKSEPDWESVSVESGGSPFPDRRNGIGENNVSGIPVETAPLRDSFENETGRREVSNGRYREIPLGDEELKTEPDRITSPKTTD